MTSSNANAIFLLFMRAPALNGGVSCQSRDAPRNCHRLLPAIGDVAPRRSRLCALALPQSVDRARLVFAAAGHVRILARASGGTLAARLDEPADLARRGEDHRDAVALHSSSDDDRFPRGRPVLARIGLQP